MSKRTLIGLLVVIAFPIYFLGTDPDTKLFQNISFGAPLILASGMIVVAATGHWILEVLYDYFIDPVYGKPRDLVEKAKQDPKASSIALLARSINLLAGAIIIAAAIMKMI